MSIAARVNITDDLSVSGGISPSGDISSSQALRGNKVFASGPDTTTSAANVRIVSGGQFQQVTSLSEHKLHQEPLSVDAVRALLSLTPKTWYDCAEVEANDGSTDGLRRITGLIAEDVAQIAPAFAEYDDEGELAGVDYRGIAVAVIPLVADLGARVEALEERAQDAKSRSPEPQEAN